MQSIGVFSIIIVTTLFILQNDMYIKSTTVTAQENKDKVLKKDIGFMNEYDLEKLYDQWEDNDDEKLPDDELPPHKRPPPAMNFGGNKFPPISKKNQPVIPNDPEQFYKMAKKGKTLMTFVTVANSESRAYTEELTGRWQIGLSNAHIRCQRFIVSDDRAIFVFEDGAQAFEAKQYFLEQPELKEYSIENQSFPGKLFANKTKDTENSKHNEL